MAQPLIVTLPPNLDLWPGCVIRVTAVHPDTGATVTGVKVSNVTFDVRVLAGSDDELIGPVLLLRGG